jgi:putative transposase
VVQPVHAQAYETVKRIHSPGDSHFITFSTAGRRPYLLNRGICTSLGMSLAKACTYKSVQLWGYVFMPNQVHLLVHPGKDTFDTGDFLRQVNRSSSLMRQRYFWEMRETLCQEGCGYDRNIYTLTELSKKLRYIHTNPVRKRLCSEETQNRWSSAGYQRRNVECLVDLSDRIRYTIVRSSG